MQCDYFKDIDIEIIVRNHSIKLMMSMKPNDDAIIHNGKCLI